MSELCVTVIDVGWGDSILIESKSGDGSVSFGLIDSNDTMGQKSSMIHLVRRFDILGIDPKARRLNFDFVVLSHAHADHAQGLLGILKYFGTYHFWYPKSSECAILANLLRYANRSKKVDHHQSIDTSKRLPKLGDASVEVFWPPRNTISANENNNSIVLAITLGKVTFILGGDAEADAWEHIVERFPKTIRVFKVPHHGAANGTFGDSNQTPWLDRCPKRASLAISSHILPYPHPDKRVVDEFATRRYTSYRTDENHHLTFITNGSSVQKKYSHFKK